MSLSAAPRIRQCLRVTVSRAFADQLHQAAGGAHKLDELIALCVQLVTGAELADGGKPPIGYYDGICRAVAARGQSERLDIWLDPWQAVEVERRARLLGVTPGRVLAGIVGAAAHRLAVAS